MSEFSESYHVYNMPQIKLSEVMSENSIPSYVFREQNNWTAFFPKTDPYMFNMQIPRIISNTLLYFVNAEDHGWSYTIYNNNEMVSGYNCEWSSGEIMINESDLNADNLKNLFPDKINTEQLNTILHPESFNDIFKNTPAYSFAQMLGLSNYQWLSFQYLSLDDSRNELDSSDYDFMKVLL
jgi:hypothetical protein